jgi:fatty-acyl-CoA synthase
MTTTLTELSTANRAPLTPLSFLERVRLAYPDKLAVVEPGGTTVSYAELSQDCDAMAGALRASGLRRGERAAVLDLNTRWLLAAHFAIPGAGAALVALNTRLAAAEYRDILAHSRAKVLLVSEAMVPRLEATSADHVPVPGPAE